jgi:hypothetical protein
MIRRAIAVAWLLGWCGLSLFALQPPPAQEGFVPVTELPPGQQLPAAPFVIGAYAFFLVLMVGYVWSVARRLNKVDKEMGVLRERASRRTGNT